MKKSKTGIFGKILLCLGIACIIGALGLTGYNLWDAGRADAAAQEVVSELEEDIESKNPSVPEETGTEQEAEEQMQGKLSDDREMPTIEIDGYRYIGYISVPSTGQRLPVMDDWDYDRLKIAPCRYAGSVYKDNMVLAGHNYRKHFSPFRWLDIGTEIVFTDVENHEYHYAIAYIEILDPDQTEAMVTGSDSWDLTLFTCTVGGQTRYTIRCVRK